MNFKRTAPFWPLATAAAILGLVYFVIPHYSSHREATPASIATTTIVTAPESAPATSTPFGDSGYTDEELAKEGAKIKTLFVEPTVANATQAQTMCSLHKMTLAAEELDSPLLAWKLAGVTLTLAKTKQSIWAIKFAQGVGKILEMSPEDRVSLEQVSWDDSCDGLIVPTDLRGLVSFMTKHLDAADVKAVEVGLSKKAKANLKSWLTLHGLNDPEIAGGDELTNAFQIQDYWFPDEADK